jgi:hypothetical protein
LRTALRRFVRQPESAGDIFAVGDDRIDMMLLADEREMFLENVATRGTHDIADGEDRDAAGR